MTIDLLQPFYPHFVPNQVLTNTQLNQLRTYLDQQERLTRIRLVGKGIVCGLTWSIDGSNNITIHEGYGVTSDGYLIELEETTYTGAHPYIDPDVDADGVPEYDPWEKNNQQIDITELIEDFVMGTEDEPGDAGPITAGTLQDQVLVLYLEQEDVDLKSCLVTECDNKGLNIRLNVKALLIPKDVPLDLCESTPSLIHIPRFHAGLLHIAGPPDQLDEVTTVAHVNDTYRQIAQDFELLLSTRIQDAFTQYGTFLDLDPTDIDALNKLSDHLTGGPGSLNQYHYDLVKDLAQAYNEFITCACELITDCCPVSDFPRHLMLGAIDREEGYRHIFMPSPVRNVMHADLEKVTKYFRRMLALVEHFDAALANDIRITPSHTELYDLGQRAVPYYYGLPPDLEDCWQPRFCCTATPLWSYHAAHVDVNGYGNEALLYDYGRFSFMRIEGHVGQLWRDAHPDIVGLRTQHNLEFDLITLHLIADAAPGGGGLPANILAILLQIEIQMLQTPRIRQIKDLFEGVPDEAGELVDKVREALEASKVQLYEAQEDWMADRCGVAIRCDIAAIQADYLLLRSEVLSLYQRIFTYLDALMDFMDGLAEFLLDEVPEFLEEKGGEEKSKIDVVERRKTVENREASLRLRLKQADEEEVRVKLRNELEVVAAERTHLVKLERVVDRSKIVLEKMRKEAAIEANAGEVEEGDLERRALYAAHLEVALLRDHVHELIHYLLPKDLTCFNYDLFTYKHQRLVQATLELRLWPIFFLWYALASNNRDDLPKPPEIIEDDGEANGGIKSDDSLFEALRALLDGDESFFETVDQDIADLVTLGLQVIGSLPALLQLFSGNYHNSLHARFATLNYLLIAHRQEDLFSRFAAAHDGMEHTAGVTKGGTFILVCDHNPATHDDALVISDFMLHGRMGCCCEIDIASLCLPPVAVPDYHIVTRPLPDDNGNVAPAQAVFNVLWNDYSLNDESEQPYQNAHKSALVLKDMDETSEQGGVLRIMDAKEGTVEYVQEDPEFYGIDAFGYTVVDAACDDIITTGRVVVLVVPAFVVQPREDTGSIEGIVTDCETGEPLVGATVRVTEVNRATVTDASGRYILSDLEPGDYLLTFAMVGYQSIERSVTVEADETTMHDACLVSVGVGLGQFIFCANDLNAIDIYLDGTPSVALSPGEATAFMPMPSEATLVQIYEKGAEPVPDNLLLEHEGDTQREHLAVFVLTGQFGDNGFAYDLIAQSHALAENEGSKEPLVSFIHSTPHRGRVKVSATAADGTGVVLAEDLAYQGIGSYVPLTRQLHTVEVVTLDSNQETTRFEAKMEQVASGSAMVWLLCGPQALIGYTASGERIVWPRVEEAIQVERGNLFVRVLDARSGEVVTGAQVRILQGETTIDIENQVNQKQVYPFTQVPVGTYDVLVQAQGFFKARVDKQQVAPNQTTTTVVRITSLRSSIPIDDVLIFRVVEDTNLTEKEATTKIRETFDARHAEKVAVLDNVIADKADIADTKTYTEARAFLAKDLPNEDLSADRLAERYEEVSALLVRTIKTTTNERRPDYTAMLEAVTQAYLDRVAASEPKEVSAEGRQHIEVAGRQLKAGGVALDRFSEGWQGTALKEELGVTSIDRMRELLR
ncbi:MAG TPA: carboxypeptidase regulatory-like domain-containing protein [Rhodothermales bacterium]|nr:carboxypeptidase regulatory-like domain-containing protein [Rhodothermales bacterium]